MTQRAGPLNYDLLFPYALPYFGYVLALVFLREPLGPTIAYVIAWILAAGGLAWAWRWLLPLRGGAPGTRPYLLASVGIGILAGGFGTLLWVLVKGPFVDAGGEAWAPSAFAMRLLVSASVVPIFEELLFRGLLFRGMTQWLDARRAGDPDPLATALHRSRVGELAPGHWSGLAWILSSVVFAAGHAPAEWLAATLYGLLMGGLVIWRHDLLTPIVAHGVTNATLALYVLQSGHWNVW